MNMQFQKFKQGNHREISNCEIEKLVISEKLVIVARGALDINVIIKKNKQV